MDHGNCGSMINKTPFFCWKMEGLSRHNGTTTRGTKRRSAIVVIDFLSPRFNTDAAAVSTTEFLCESPRKARVGAGEEEK